MKIMLKRIYDRPEKSDGFRVLIDRLWPRGVTKARAKIDLWAKDAAPSTALRMWYHVNRTRRYREFTKRYTHELKEGKARALRKALSGKGTVTFVTSIKELERSHVPVLLKSMQQKKGIRRNVDKPV